jgi:hypothetical protein
MEGELERLWLVLASMEDAPAIERELAAEKMYQRLRKTAHDKSSEPVH